MRGSRLVAAGLVFGAVLLVAVMLVVLSSSRDRLTRMKARHQEAIALSAEHMELARRLKGLEGRQNLTNVKGVVHAVDEIFVPLGLKDKVKSVKVVGPSGADEERAEVTVQATDMNETVNFLHSLENSPMPLVIKKISIRASFENPEKLNTTMTLSFIKPQ